MIKYDEEICSELNFEKPNLIGVGVFGRVYKAYDKKTKEVKCIKIIPEEKFKSEEWELSEKLKNKKNENLIIFSEMKIFKEKRLVALVMDYISGGDLKTYVDNHNNYFSPKEIYDLTYQICLF
jgi:serine/threonine protein kinase